MRSRIVTVVFAVWAMSAVAAYAEIEVTGVVKDPSGAVVADATVTVMTAEQTAIATGQTDALGRFTLRVPSSGRYLLLARAPSLGEARRPLTVGNNGPSSIELTLGIDALREDVTVTASPNLVEDVRRAGQPVNVIDSTDIQTRVTTAVAQAVEG